MNIIDSHSHLHSSKDFPDYMEVLGRARAVGVSRQVLIGCDLDDSRAALEMSQSFDDFDYTIGVHPHEAKDFDELSEQALDKMLRLTDELDGYQKRAVAIGEIGLDYFKNLSDKNSQKEAFKRQLDLSIRWNIPVVLHVRDAFEDTFAILDEFKPRGAVFHCFCGGVEEMKWIRTRGYLVSFSGIVTYPKSLELQKAALEVDSLGFLVETDCPYLAPQTMRGKRNEPAFVVETAKFVANLRAVSLEDLAEQTTKNTLDFFKIKN